MEERADYRKSAKNAHNQANQAAESSRRHSNDLGKMIRSAKGSRDHLTDGQDRQRKREQNSARTKRLRLQAMESQLTSAFN